MISLFHGCIILSLHFFNNLQSWSDNFLWELSQVRCFCLGKGRDYRRFIDLQGGNGNDIGGESDVCDIVEDGEEEFGFPRQIVGKQGGRVDGNMHVGEVGEEWNCQNRGIYGLAGGVSGNIPKNGGGVREVPETQEGGGRGGVVVDSVIPAYPNLGVGREPSVHAAAGGGNASNQDNGLGYGCKHGDGYCLGHGKDKNDEDENSEDGGGTIISVVEAIYVLGINLGTDFNERNFVQVWRKKMLGVHPGCIQRHGLSLEQTTARAEIV